MAATLAPPSDVAPAQAPEAAPAPALAPAATNAAPRSAAPDLSQPAPATRDRFVDAVRAIATVAIVTVHWLMPEVTWDGRTLWIGNALGHGAAWTLTWVLQVLPLLFFAAGASAAYQHARRAPRTGWGTVVADRLRGVLRPVGAFAGAWVVAIGALLAVGVPDAAVWRVARIAPQLLWFLAVWAGLVALTPVLVRAWRRWRWSALAVAVAAPLAVDLLRFGAGLEPAGWANVLLVWAVPFLAGVAYAEHRLKPAAARPQGPRAARAGLATVVVAIVALVALVVVGPYPLSLIGMPGDAISNLAPPTAPVVAQAVAQVAVVLLARDVLTQWADGRGRAIVAALARRSMTVYLWHLTAMFAVIGVVLLGLHEQLPAPWTTDWWTTRPVWFGAFALVLTGLVRVFGRFETRRGTRRAARAARATPGAARIAPSLAYRLMSPIA